MWRYREEVAECAYPQLYSLWRSTGQRSQCCEEHPGKGISLYPGAQGNIRFAGKRFWTDCLYSSLPTEDEQAGWLKEEPPSIYGGSVRSFTDNSFTSAAAGIA